MSWKGALLGASCIAGTWIAPSISWAQLVPSGPVQDFVPPPVGSYRLPPIQEATDGWVLDGNYFPRRLSSYTHGAVTLLSFIYTYCTDPIGCPLAYATLDSIKQRALADPVLKGKIRMVSLSFDPTNDTPSMMRTYGGPNARDERLPWKFLTTYGMWALKPILAGFGQDIDVVYDANGKPTRALAHMLKMFLIDPHGHVREVYSAAFLHPDVILNDLRTIALESRP